MRAALLIPGMAVLLCACAQEHKGTVIARVGDSELTLETAKSHIDTTRGPMVAQLRDYAATWTTTELLYKEASRLGIDASPELQLQIADVRRQLITERYLTVALSESSTVVDEDSMKAFYLSHAKEFLLRENMLKLHIMICSGRESASNFAARVVQLGNWNGAAGVLSSDSSGAHGTYNDVPPQFYTQSSLYPPELWRVAFSLSQNEVSFPVRSGEAYYVLQLLSTAQQGKPAEFEIVRDEVRQRMIMERKRKAYADLLGTLRRRYAVEVLLNVSAVADSGQGRIRE